MPSLTIRPGLMAGTHGNMNSACVAQVILNRILSANSNELKVQDIADQLDMSVPDCRASLAHLSTLGLLNVGGLDLNHCDTIAPAGLVMLANVVEDSSLFKQPGLATASDGTPAMLRAPVYESGFWYRARFLNEANTKLTIERCAHGTGWSSVMDDLYQTTEDAHKAILDYAGGLADDQPVSLVYDGKPCVLVATTTTNDGETTHVLDLKPDGGGQSINTTTGSTLAEAYQIMLAWHRKASDPANRPDPAAGDKPKGGKRGPKPKAE